MGVCSLRRLLQFASCHTAGTCGMMMRAATRGGALALRGLSVRSLAASPVSTVIADMRERGLVAGTSRYGRR